MKKILSLVLAVLMLAAVLVSCGGESAETESTKAPAKTEAPESTASLETEAETEKKDEKVEGSLDDLSAAIVKTAGEEAFAGTFSTVVSISMPEANTEMEMKDEGTMEVGMVDGKPASYTVITSEVLGEKAVTKTYVCDGYAYIDVNGEKSLNMTEYDSSIPDIEGLAFTSELVESFTCEKANNGTKYILEFDKGALDEFLGDFTVGSDSTAGIEIESAEFVVEDGYCVGLSITFAGTADDEDVGKSEYSVTMAIEYTEFGGDVEVTVPEDLDAWAE